MDSQGDTGLGGERLPPVIRCADVAIDLRRRVVTLQGRRVDLNEAYLNALFLLVERSPAAVPKGELATAAGTSDDSLYKVIETVRKALGDTSEPRRLIVNERSVGYRFIGEVSPAAADQRPNGASAKGDGSPPEVGQSISDVPGAAPSAIRPPPHGAPRPRWLWLALVVVVCLGTIFAVAAILHRGNPPVIVSLDGPVLVARDASGREVWRHLFERGFDNSRYAPANIGDRYWTGDLDGDGDAEMLFLYDCAIRVGGLPPESSSLFCFSQAGKVKWKFQVGHIVRDSSGDIHPPFSISAVQVVFSPATPRSTRIVVASGHGSDQACQLAFLDTAGHLVAEYWHPGLLPLLRGIPAGPGRPPRLLAGGVNNGEHRATLVELDPFAMRGASTPSQMMDQKFRLLGMPEAHEEAVILFPRTSLSRDENYTRIGAFSVDDSGVHVRVVESYNDASNRVVYYDFDPALRLTRAFVSSNYQEEHMKLEKSGAISGSWQDEEARLPQEVVYRRNIP
jgi:DNA-binding winged helix-turn-helix (wHTH) protein